MIPTRKIIYLGDRIKRLIRSMIRVTLVLVLVFAPHLSFAKTPTFERNSWIQDNERIVPQINDNTIIVKGAGQDSSAFLKIKRAVITNGYRVIESDKEIGYLTTDYKPFEGSSIAVEPTMAVTIMIEDDNVIMYANYKFKGSAAFGGGDYEGRADYQKRTSIGRRLAFDELVLLAKKIGPNIRYTLR